MDARTTAIRPTLAALALLALGLLPAGAIPGPLARLQRAILDDGPNSRDYARIERGYYERLIDPPRRGEVPGDAGPHAPFDAGVLALAVDDVREYVLKPNLGATHRGATWTTNALGMRDRPYPIDKPGETFRVALVGDSIACGWGVDDGLGFEPNLERLWDDRSAASGGPRVEVLNFAVPGHAPGQRWEHFARVGAGTTPDLVLFEGTLADLGWDERRLRALLPRGLGPDAPAYREALASVGITAEALKQDVQTHSFKDAIRPHRESILRGVYRRVVGDCRDRGVPAVWVLLPRVGKPVVAADRARIRGLAEEAGFDLLVDLADAFEGTPPSTLAIAPADFHPNAAGHAELARRLDGALGGLVSSATAPLRTQQGRGRPRATGRPEPAPVASSPTGRPTAEGVDRR